MRTMTLEINGIAYEVGDDGTIVRLPTDFRKTSKKLKPSLTKSGYMRLCLRGCHMFVHRMVYMAFNGEIPDGMDIDHINGNRDDNRIENLRIATRKENALNRHRANINSASGVRGVHFHKSSRCWVFSVSGKPIKSSRTKEVVIATAIKHHG